MQELKRGQKWGHWRWYVFPQVKGLCRSQTAEHFAIQSKEEALAYLHHPILGSRLVACTNVVNEHKNTTAEQIFGYPDYLKFRSSMTLFEKIEGEGGVYTKALQQYFNGEPDMRTISILNSL
jgi:uncharacterized protein (DUF1810 family)